MVQIENSAPIALAFLFKRLKWPVPMVRWLAAKEIRNLLNAPTTRDAATKQLLESLIGCSCEYDVCALLSIIFMTATEARPAQAIVASNIKHPSLLGDMLLERIYGSGMGGWDHTHAGEAPYDFEASNYFEKYCTAHVPPILQTNLRRLERASGFPFVQQWAFEWEFLRDNLGTTLTEYAHYFGDSLEARSGIIGQFWQRMRDVYVSAYLRTLAHAISEWGLPQHIAEGYCLDIVEAVAGIFDIEFGNRPKWLSNLPEQFFAPDADLDKITRELLTASQQEGMTIVSLDLPISTSVHKYARLQLTAHLITENYQVPHGKFLYEKMPILPIDKTFSLEGPPANITLEEANSNGSLGGSEAAVCTCLFPIPFGTWQSDLFGVGLTIPAPYIVSNTKINCTAAGINLLSESEELVSTTRVWNDNWTPTHPKSGSTRCGVTTMMDKFYLERAKLRLDRNLVFFVRLRTWARTEEYGDYTESEINKLITF
ncbi:hypothetical protein IFR35_22775 [Pseudomonas fluorescens]|uniref:hypothetical protein n=1 Tax=Pseudomonas fluorescens TaxID=294 RepID=UPI001786AE35|nr:hypothetical protein [Pseudomonas fluorescens]MBD8194225.1 hypothetical protein [Pseudomonas fluorescens]MBD8228966.1 hypothetical protein [Pseudomonas fluorescens]MBD8787035.1 hypothetical protein [Pseudomonas fluorescens]MBD8819131.1 hypothetical protein [Pseudomonas fluorescens]